jgi:O-antigen/teichoic acid export membrane protein
VSQPDAGKLFVADGLTLSAGAEGGAMVIGRVVGLARGIALTWLVTQEEFGLFHVGMAAVNLLVPVCSLGLPQGVLRYAPAYEAGGMLSSFARRAAQATLIVALIGSVLLIVAAGPLGDIVFSPNTDIANPSNVSGTASAVSGGSVQLVRIAAACVFSLVLFHLVSHLMKGLRLFRAASLMEIVGATSFSVAAIVVAVMGHRTAVALLLTYAASNVVSVLVFLPSLLVCLRSYPSAAGSNVEDAGVGARLLKYSVWMAGTALMWNGVLNYALWHVAKVGGNDLAGVFRAMGLLAQPLIWCATGAATVLSAHVLRVWESADRERAITGLRAAGKAGMLVIMIIATVLSLSKTLLVRMFRDEYAFGLECLDPMLLGYAWFAATILLSIRFHVAERSVLSFWTWFVGLSVSVVAAYVLMGSPWVIGSAGIPPQELVARAGCVCAAGGGASVVMCLVLLTRHGMGSDGVMSVLIVATLSVGFGGLISLIVVGVLLAALRGGVGAFTVAERRMCREFLQRRRTSD